MILVGKNLQNVDVFNHQSVNQTRVIFLNDKNDTILIKKDDVFVFPGCIVGNDERADNCLIKYLKDEFRLKFNVNDFGPIIEKATYYENYIIESTNEIKNIYNVTDCFMLETTLNFEELNISEIEKNNNFEILILNVDEALKLVNNYHSTNKMYDDYKDEMLSFLNVLKNFITMQKKVKHDNIVKTFKKSEKLIDMHIHSLYSDGELSPNELVELAFNYDIGTIAITDHDTINGIKNLNRNSSLIVDSGINVIDGIELSAKVDKGIMHILGYGIDKNNELLNKKLNKIRDINVNTVLSYIEILKNDYNIYFSYDDLRNLINSNHNLGRPDVARLLMKNGYVKSVPEAFDKYLIAAREKLGKRLKGIPFEECIDLIIKSGGIPVLAHPKTLKLDNNDLRELIRYMKSIGLSGVEVYHSIHSEEERNDFLNIANDYNLLISGGTDYHGPVNKPYIKLGSGENNNVKIRKLSLVDELNRKMQL